MKEIIQLLNNLLFLLKSNFTIKKKLFCLLFVQNWQAKQLKDFFTSKDNKLTSYGLYRNIRVRNVFLSRLFIEFLPIDEWYISELIEKWSAKNLSFYLCGKSNAKLFNKIVFKLKEDKRYKDRYVSFFALCLILKNSSYDLLIKKVNILLTPLKYISVNNNYTFNEIEQVRILLSNYKESRVSILLGNNFEELNQVLLNHLFDCGNIYSKNKITLPKKPKNAKYLSQYLIKHHQLKIKKEFIYNYEKRALALENKIVDGFIIKLPKSSHELIRWSLELENCLNNYEEKIQTNENKTKDTVVFLGLFKNNKLEYVAELKQYVLHDIKGIRNTDDFNKRYELSQLISGNLYN